MKDKYYEQAVACVKDYVLPAQRELYKSCGARITAVFGSQRVYRRSKIDKEADKPVNRDKGDFYHD